MSAIEALQKAQKFALSNKPAAGGFPFLAEVLRQSGVTRNIWHLPSCQNVYLTKTGPVVSQGTPLLRGYADVPQFNPEELIRVLRKDQAGQSSFPEFLKGAWESGVVRYDVDFEKRVVSYFGINEEIYVEEYPSVNLNL
ncbi:MAG: DUF1398 domain-containing protein [Proteobacteria bacterium]|nr:MAG: DUF1398 domain-containing protein [Pseudomonadota bacterium]